VQAAGYKPGQAQTLRVTVSHPEAQRWGFEIVARWAKDPTQTAGTFNATNSAVQVPGDYATHTSDGTLAGGSNGTKTFEIEWMAPSGSEDGDIIFYAAGNAANNNNQNTGDRIYTTQTRVQPDAACGSTERPILTRIIDAASGGAAGSSNSILTLQGRNFATATAREAHGGYIRDNKYPTELNCVAVEIGGQRVPILYVQNDQINIQAPTLTQTGAIPVRVIVNPDRQNAIPSDQATVTIQNFSPSFFTFAPTRSIAARIPNGGPIVADPGIVPGARPARPGEIIELYGTGLGPTQTPVASGALTPNQAISTTNRVTVTVGGTTLAAADVFYAGLAPGNISGLYQVNVRIPASAGNGDVPVTMAIGGVESAAGTTIPVRTQ
jgi:uncharacterized protein (TIGR03437 family)